MAKILSLMQMAEELFYLHQMIILGVIWKSTCLMLLEKISRQVKAAVNLR